MVLVEDMTNNYPIAVAEDDTKGLELAKEYVKKMFDDYDKSSYQLKSHYHKDIRKKDMIGISISDIDVGKISTISRTNYFWGHIRRNGTVVNKNEVI